jgi:hypothetical protein
VQGAAPSEVALTIDDVSVPGASMGIALPADPGRHRAVGKTYAQTLELAIDLVEGESKDAFLRFNEWASTATPATVPAEGASANHLTIHLTNPGSPEPAGTSQSVYAKWWFWSGVGAVVVAGTVTALLLAHRSGGAWSGAIYTCKGVQ